LGLGLAQKIALQESRSPVSKMISVPRIGGIPVSIGVLAKGLAAGVIALGMFTFPAWASDPEASQCKGLTQEACTAKAECSWVSATKRKDGTEVKAYCRAKPKKSASASPASK
jgi:hypothetical protein